MKSLKVAKTLLLGLPASIYVFIARIIWAWRAALPALQTVKPTATEASHPPAGTRPCWGGGGGSPPPPTPPLASKTPGGKGVMGTTRDDDEAPVAPPPPSPALGPARCAAAPPRVGTPGYRPVHINAAAEIACTAAAYSTTAGWAGLFLVNLFTALYIGMKVGFSIVRQHALAASLTGPAAAATRRTAAHTAAGGILSVHLHGRGRLLQNML
jgi:hypothetical protein